MSVTGALGRATTASGFRSKGKRAGYYVVTASDAIVGGAGFGPLASGPTDVCELRKMYFLPEIRGHGMGRKLLLFVLEQAKRAGYARCYLETLAHMTRARSLSLRRLRGVV